MSSSSSPSLRERATAVVQQRQGNSGSNPGTTPSQQPSSQPSLAPSGGGGSLLGASSSSSPPSPSRSNYQYQYHHQQQHRRNNKQTASSSVRYLRGWTVPVVCALAWTLCCLFTLMGYSVSRTASITQAATATLTAGTTDSDKVTLGPPSTTSKWQLRQQHQEEEHKQPKLLTKKRARGVPHKFRTETGINLLDRGLYEGYDLGGDSSTATIMGMASGYDMSVYQRFVGTLRKTGYKGHIILGVAPNVKPAILEYLEARNVTAKLMTWVNCTYTKTAAESRDIFKKTTCAHPYPDIKIRWSRFPLQRDWLRGCETCTGPVLVMDVRDSYFQRDPFGEGSPPVVGLQVFEEHKNQTTDHWLTKWPLRQCKNVTYAPPKTMLCSGTTAGTRIAMLKYLEIMYAEMRSWISKEKCRFDINGDDQSMHNYLYYSGQLPFATAIENRAGGIVHTVGKEAAAVARQHRANQLARHGYDHGKAMWQPFDGAGGKRWIGKEFDLTNDQGEFTEFDGSVSRVIHQWDRFGRPLINLWMDKKTAIFRDPIVTTSTRSKQQQEQQSDEKKQQQEQQESKMGSMTGAEFAKQVQQ